MVPPTMTANEKPLLSVRLGWRCVSLVLNCVPRLVFGARADAFHRCHVSHSRISSWACVKRSHLHDCCMGAYMGLPTQAVRVLPHDLA